MSFFTLYIYIHFFFRFASFYYLLTLFFTILLVYTQVSLEYSMHLEIFCSIFVCIMYKIMYKIDFTNGYFQVLSWSAFCNSFLLASNHFPKENTLKQRLEKHNKEQVNPSWPGLFLSITDDFYESSPYLKLDPLEVGS